MTSQKEDPNKVGTFRYSEFLSWWDARTLVDGYLSNGAPWQLTTDEYNFEALLEKHLIESGKIHTFIRQAFSAEHCDLDVDIIDFVNGFAKDFVQSERLKNA